MSDMDVNQLLDKQRRYFLTGATLPLKHRKAALWKLRQAIREREKEIIAALRADLDKPEFEAYSNEIGILYLEINHALKKLARWMRPTRKWVEMHLQPGRGRIHYEPYGNTLIIGPWNYPFQLMIAPLVAAIAAGNTAVLKPSEISIHTGKVLTDLIRSTFDGAFVAAVNGGVPETTALLKLSFDKIFFTGSVPVGRIVMKAAAENLTPLTLELGGKSPAIVDKSARLRQASRKIAWAKFNNAGQTCVAPDYLLVHEEVYDAFLEHLKQTVLEFYGEDPRQHPEYGRIISHKHFDRLAGMIQPDKVFLGGRVDRETRYIAPTIITKVSLSDPVMEDEIFGPILPVLSYRGMEDALGIIRSFPKPLALYVFSRRKEVKKFFVKRAAFGGGGINTALMHVASSHLPFGGVGKSGMGRYHGRSGFLEFSNAKSVLSQPACFDPGLAYPGNHLSMRWIKKIMK